MHKNLLSLKDVKLVEKESWHEIKCQIDLQQIFFRHKENQNLYPKKYPTLEEVRATADPLDTLLGQRSDQRTHDEMQL